MANPKRNPNPVADWADALSERLAGPKIPAHAESIDEMRVRMHKRGMRMTNRGIMIRLAPFVESGEYVVAVGRKKTDRRNKTYFWPK